MKIKLDENLPEALLASLAESGHDVDNVRLEQIAGQPDQTIWQAAQASNRFLITQDLDFSDIRRFAPGTHHGLMLVRLREPGRLALAAKVAAAIKANLAEEWIGAFVLLTDSKLRIHSPNKQNDDSKHI
jgi:predicted nuclease of predicted toxin-antitoxin system